jgi:hypothetical protein
MHAWETTSLWSAANPKSSTPAVPLTSSLRKSGSDVCGCNAPNSADLVTYTGPSVNPDSCDSLSFLAADFVMMKQGKDSRSSSPSHSSNLYSRLLTTGGCTSVSSTVLSPNPPATSGSMMKNTSTSHPCMTAYRGWTPLLGLLTLSQTWVVQI